VLHAITMASAPRRITALTLISPGTYQPIAALKYLETEHVLTVKQGDQWRLELTFEYEKREKSKDLRPELPMIVRYGGKPASKSRRIHS
jgi:hypothetical protein